MKWRLLFASALLFANSSFSQSGSAELPKIIPVSPEVAALGKYGDIPVGFQTGTANISIPLATLKHGSRETSISLSYHTGGNKVEEIASSVGMGWSINAGGTISRAQRGLPDDGTGGYFYTVTRTNRYMSALMDATENRNYVKDLYCGYVDGEADLFNYSFDGYSGKFFLGSDSVFYTIPRSNLKISYNTGNSSWTIVDDRGFSHYFTVIESTTVTPYCNGNNNPSATNNNAWHLAKSVDQFNDSINYHYYYEYTQRYMVGTDEYNIPNVGTPSSGACPPEHVYCTNEVTNGAYKLGEIKSRAGRILLATGSQRSDFSGSYVIDRILLLNPSNDTIKKMKLYTSYFPGTRLRLDSISEMNGTEKSGTYVFTYNNSVAFPYPTSFSQDYWGFYNGAANSTLVQYQLTPTGPYIGANRRSNFNYADVGMLKSIKYPTGGSTAFEYESNVYALPRDTGLDFEETTHYHYAYGNNAPPEDYQAITTSNFTVSSGDIIPIRGYMAVRAKVNYTCSDLMVFNSFNLSLTGNNGYAKYWITDGDTLHLPPGYYTLTGIIETEFANIPSAYFTCDLYKIKWDPRDMKNYRGGGVRIKNIKRYDSINPTPVTELYNYNLPNDTISSGYLSGGLPSLIPYTKQARNPLTSDYCAVTTYSAISTYPLLETSGKPVAYQYVEQKLDGSTGNGRKLFRFSTYSDYPDIVYAGFPFIPSEDHSWRRGNLVHEKTYKSVPGSEELVTETKNKYFEFGDTVSSYLSVAKNVRVGVRYNSAGYYSCANEVDFAIGNDGFHIAGYRVVSEPFVTKTDTVVNYNSSNYQVAGHNYGLNNNNFTLYADSTSNSKSELVTVKNSFAKDYTSNSGLAGFISKLLLANKVTTPIETLKLVYKGGQTYVLSGELKTYNASSLLPDSLYLFQPAEPLLLSSFTQSSVNTNGGIIKDSRYKLKIVFAQYDSYGNLQQVKKEYDQSLAYIWDYKSVYPIAEVKNAAFSDIAYTSFEADGKGGWTYSGIPANDTSFTGKKSYTLSYGPVSRNLNLSKSYILSFWKKGTVTVSAGSLYRTGRTVNGWTYVEYYITESSSISLSGSVSIDELRLYPAESQMTSYTYEPLLGISSQSDMNGNVMYYEHDNFGRLKFIKDTDKNIIKAVEYQYQKPVTQ